LKKDCLWAQLYISRGEYVRAGVEKTPATNGRTACRSCPRFEGIWWKAPFAGPGGLEKGGVNGENASWFPGAERRKYIRETASKGLPNQLHELDGGKSARSKKSPKGGARGGGGGGGLLGGNGKPRGGFHGLIIEGLPREGRDQKRRQWEKKECFKGKRGWDGSRKKGGPIPSRKKIGQEIFTGGPKKGRSNRALSGIKLRCRSPSAKKRRERRASSNPQPHKGRIGRGERNEGFRNRISKKESFGPSGETKRRRFLPSPPRGLADRFEIKKSPLVTGETSGCWGQQGGQLKKDP